MSAIYTPSTSSNNTTENLRRLIKEVHDVFNIVRQLVSDNLVLSSQIDVSYEQTLIDELRLVPEQYDNDILTTLRIVKTFIKHISFSSIANDLIDIAGDSIRFNINTFAAFQTTFEHIDLSRKDRMRVMNIVKKFKPLFSCIDSMMSKPIELVRKIGAMQTNSYDNIFD